MGIQSFSDKELSVLGRQHNAEKARQAFALIKTYDFPCVNVDFIYGIPGQTAASLLESLKEALQFEPEEIFLYPLYVKHGARMEREGVVLEPETAFAQYQAASSFLRGNGYRHASFCAADNRTRFLGMWFWHFYWTGLRWEKLSGETAFLQSVCHH